MPDLLARLRAVPLRAAPRVAARLVRRRWQALTAPARPRPLAESDLLAALRPPLAQAGPAQAAAHFAGGRRPRLLRPPAALGPEARARLVAQAEEIAAHRFDLLGSGPTSLGERIDWRRDFKSGHAWPLAHFTRLTMVDLQAGFDIKVPWELSRFHHGVTLAQAYALTGDERHAAEFAAQVTAWLQDNPPEFGPNWANAMEAAIRAANWLAAYDLLAAAPALTPEFHLAFIGGLLGHGRYTAAHLESGWPGTNHYLADLCGLVVLGALLPELREAARWLNIGLKRLAQELGRQVYPDGADYEASTGYHYLVTEMVLWAVLACRAGGVTPPPSITARLEQMLTVLAGLLKPDGALPAFGDLDSGRWLALESDTAALPSGQDAPGLLALGAALFGRADWRGARAEAAYWIDTGGKGQAASRKPQGSKPSSRAFPHAGWYVMRSGEHYLAVDAGGVGSDGWGGHAHNGTLGFELAVGGRSFLVDPGSYVYTGDYQARNAFRATAMHNTLAVDGQEINRIPELDMFRLENDAEVRVLLWEAAAAHDRLIAEHTGFARLGALHRREFYFDKGRGFWLLRDQVLPVGPPSAALHRIDVAFHFAPLPVVVGEYGARTACAAGVNLLVLPLGEARLQMTQEPGWVSPRYGVRRPAPVVRCAAQASLPAEFTFALWPFAGEPDEAALRAEAEKLQRELG